jgi:LAS superfamily LD-carboxypeptidase LdcB
MNTFADLVLERQVAARMKRRGPAHPDLTAADLALVPGTRIRMRKDSARAAGRLLAAATAALAKAKAAGDIDAIRTRSLTATSGYRSRAHQERVWREYFPSYYDETAKARAKLPGGPHGEAAIIFMQRYMGARVGAPGFSNHQRGTAIDFAQVRRIGHRIRNSTAGEWPSRWRASWFHHWLIANAGSFGFVPYPKEPWHWEHEPT